MSAVSVRFMLFAALTALMLNRSAFGEQFATPLPASQAIVQDDPKQFTLTGDGRSKASSSPIAR